MERLTVDTEGKVVIPPEVVSRFGLHPGNETALVQTPESLIICDEALAEMEEWWNSLTEEEKIEAREEADWYESLSEAEKDAIWNQDAADSHGKTLW
jgi:bifunctional DNA-binding transcriptional regulator/antitoxin component of YhaV-PrlF toxin-antitoxin module